MYLGNLGMSVISHQSRPQKKKKCFSPIEHTATQRPVGAALNLTFWRTTRSSSTQRPSPPAYFISPISVDYPLKAGCALPDK